MKAITMTGAGGPEVLELGSAPVPAPAVGEVLIRVAAAGVNRPDVWQRRGLYPPPPDASPRLGLEVSGTIVDAHPTATRWPVGTSVCALVSGGGYAEYCAAPEGQCLPIPSPVSVRDAAGIPETAFTVWANLIERGRLAEGEVALIHGGASGIGTTAIQLARARGARVIVTAGSDEKCRACEALGAEAAINYRRDDFVAAARALTSGRGVDVVLDIVGGDYVPRNLEVLADDGRLVMIGRQRGGASEIDGMTIMRRRLTITGSTLRARSLVEKARLAGELHRHVWPLFEAARMRVVVDRVFTLAEAADAHRHMEADRHVGKILLQVES